jgi:hypothetical protein
MRTQIHPKRMKSLGLQELLTNGNHRKHLKQRKNNWNQKKALEKGDEKTPKKKGKYGINRKVLRNEIVKTPPKKKEKKMGSKQSPSEMRLQKHPRGREKNDHFEFRVELSVGS